LPLKKQATRRYIHTYIHTYHDRVAQAILAEKRDYEEKKQEELLAEKKYDDTVEKAFLKHATAPRPSVHVASKPIRHQRGRHVQDAHHANHAHVVSAGVAQPAHVVDVRKTGVNGKATAHKASIRKVAVKAKENMDLSSWLIDEEKEAHDELASYANVRYACVWMCKNKYVYTCVCERENTWISRAG
jgi:hypothetical protein